MKLIQPECWIPCDGIELENAAKYAVQCDSNVLVVAGPGAGKTELLAQKAAYLFQTDTCRNPQKILAISFKTDAAQNLKERVEKRCGADAKFRFSSMTYDAFSKRVLDQFLYALPNHLRPQADYLVNDDIVVDAAFKEAGYSNPDHLYPSKLKTLYDLTLTRVSLHNLADDLGSRVWSLLINGFGDNKATLTFKMISMLADYIIQTNPKIVRALQLTYRHVFLDEFQDTTGLQYNFIKHCFFNSQSKITAVGDNKQRIMLWAGAQKNIFKTFYSEFAPEGVRLIMNHRSAPRLINLQKAMYASLKEKHIEINPADKWDSNDGSISLIISDDEKLEAHAVAERISKDISSGIEPNDICILCKQLPPNYSSDIILELENLHVRARIETEYQDLIKEPIIDLLLNIMSCAINRKQPQKWEKIESTIMDVWGTSTATTINLLDKQQAKLFDAVNKIRSQITDTNSNNNLYPVIETIVTLLDTACIKSYYPAYRQGNYLDELLNMFTRLFEVELQATDGNWLLAIENFCGKHSVPIMTIHKSKGLEYSSVYFVGLEDSAFWNFKKQPEEDRCAFFVALSRAKKSVTFTYCKRRSNLKSPNQFHTDINEFFVLLQEPGMAEITQISTEYA